jgi:hypothetical protein
MCWRCDHPGATYDEYLTYMHGLITRWGWAVQGVQRDGPHPPWAYTAGLTEAGLAELVVTGMRVRPATRLLNEVAAHAIHAGLPPPGERFAMTDGPMLEVVEISEAYAHLVIAAELYGPQIRALQLVHADDRGRWPWESGYRGLQPVLGPRGSRTTAA